MELVYHTPIPIVDPLTSLALWCRAYSWIKNHGIRFSGISPFTRIVPYRRTAAHCVRVTIMTPLWTRTIISYTFRAQQVDKRCGVRFKKTSLWALNCWHATGTSPMSPYPIRPHHHPSPLRHYPTLTSRALLYPTWQRNWNTTSFLWWWNLNTVVPRMSTANHRPPLLHRPDIVSNIFILNLFRCFLSLLFISSHCSFILATQKCWKPSLSGGYALDCQLPGLVIAPRSARELCGEPVSHSSFIYSLNESSDRQLVGLSLDQVLTCRLSIAMHFGSDKLSIWLWRIRVKEKKLFPENAFQNIVREMAIILPHPQCLKQ